MIIAIILLVTGLLVFAFVKKRATPKPKNLATINTSNFVPLGAEVDQKFKAVFSSAQFPDRIADIDWHKKAINKAMEEGDLTLANLSYAKLIESIRQQSVNEPGLYEATLSEVRKQYDHFRLTYGMEYPSQFLPPRKSNLNGFGIDDANQLPEIKVKIDRKKLKALIASINGKGNSQYPLLRKEYESRIPYMDFSGWVIEQLRQRDYDSLFAFINEFYKQDGDGAFDDTLKSKFEKFLMFDFGSLFTNIEEQAVDEIKAFFILQYGFEKFNREFWIVAGKQADMLATVLSVYPFSINQTAFIQLMNHANMFIKDMAKDNEYWKEFGKYKKEHLKLEKSPTTKSNLLVKLKQLTPGERLHFFDFASGYEVKKFWNGNSSYKTRTFGINENQSISHMVEVGLFDHVNDINSIPDISSKSEFKEAAAEAGFDIKKSWTLDKTFENLIKAENGPAFLSRFIEGKTVLLLNNEYWAHLGQLFIYRTAIQRTIDLIAMV